MKNLERKTLKLKGDLTLVSVEDSGALLDVEKRCYYDLNDTAFFLLKRMEEGCYYEELQVALISAFQVDMGTAQRDIDGFIMELVRRDLLSTDEERSAQEKTDVAMKNKRPYYAPVLDYQKELAVASANGASFTIGITAAN